MTPEQLTRIERTAQEHIDRCAALDARLRTDGRMPTTSGSVVPHLARQILELAAELRKHVKGKAA